MNEKQPISPQENTENFLSIERALENQIETHEAAYRNTLGTPEEISSAIALSKIREALASHGAQSEWTI